MPHDLTTAAGRFEHLLDQITGASPEERIAFVLSRFGNPGICRGCKASVTWIRHANGKSAPYTAEGLNHFADCPAAATFKKP